MTAAQRNREREGKRRQTCRSMDASECFLAHSLGMGRPDENANYNYFIKIVPNDQKGWEDIHSICLEATFISDYLLIKALRTSPMY